MTQPESKLSRRFMDHLRKWGAWVFKVHGGPMQPSGIPDIVGVYGGQFIAVESKMPGNELSDIQVYRIGRIRAAGGLVCIAYGMADVQQFMIHVSRHHFSTPPTCRAISCPLYGKKAPLDVIP